MFFSLREQKIGADSKTGLRGFSFLVKSFDREKIKGGGHPPTLFPYQGTSSDKPSSDTTPSGSAGVSEGVADSPSTLV